MALPLSLYSRDLRRGPSSSRAQQLLRDRVDRIERLALGEARRERGRQGKRRNAVEVVDLPRPHAFLHVRQGIELDQLAAFAA